MRDRDQGQVLSWRGCTRPQWSRCETGTATIPIGPPLRAAAAVSEPLVLSMPSVAMRLVSDDEAINPSRPGRFTAITIRLEEPL